MTTSTSIRLDIETNQRLEMLAKRTGRTKSFYMRELINKGLPQLEYEYQILQEAIDHRVNKNLETYTIEEMIARYDLDD